MLRKIALLSLLGFITLSKAESNAKPKNPPVAIVKYKNQTVTLYTSQLIQLMLGRLQILTKIPTQQEVQALLTECKKELVALAVHYIHNQTELLANDDFMKQALFQAMLLARDTKISETAEKINDAEIKAEYDIKIKEMPLPKQFRLKVAVFTNETQAKQALESLESGIEFAQILKASTKEFTDGDILDPSSSSQFVSVHSTNVPPQVKAVLANTSKIGLLPIITVTNDKGQNVYWIIRVLKIKDGTINDLPKLDLKNTNIKNSIARSAAFTKLMKHANDLVSKDASVEYIDITPASGASSVSNA